VQTAANVSAEVQRPDALIALALAGIAFAAFAPSIGHGFIVFDDPYYVFRNPYVRNGCTPANIRWAFTAFEIGNWHPLTWLSLQLDASLWGTDPRGFHLTNVLLHAGNACLLFLALRALTGGVGVSAATALLFAIHPLRVESVAWVSERKDVLSTFFAILALWAWARYVAAPTKLRYSAVIVGLLLSLLSKPMFVTFPFLLLVLDWWPTERVQRFSDWWRLIVEKLPLFLVVAISAVITYLAQSSGGATRTWAEFSPLVRLANATASYVAYLSKTFLPAGLAFYYPHVALPAWKVVGSVLLLTALTIAAVVLRRRAPYLLAGWLWYLGTLVPVIGLVQIGDQAMADRYSYFPQIGLLLALCCGVAALLANQRRLIIPVLAVPVLALFVATFYQLRLWHDPLALFERSLQTTGSNRAIYDCLASLHEERGELEQAELCLRAALDREPDNALTLTKLGSLLSRQGKLDEAVGVLEKARDLAPDFALARSRLGRVYYKHGELDKATREFVKCCELQPNSPEGYTDLGTVYLQQHRFQDAAGQFAKAREIVPDESETYVNSGLAAEGLGDFATAAKNYAKALSLRPDFVQARAGLGVALSRLGRKDEGLAQLQAAVHAEPGFVNGHVLLGKALANRGDFAGAAQHLGEAVRLDPTLASAWHDLGLVQQHQGQSSLAARSFRRAAELEAGLGRQDDQLREQPSPTDQ
jgi:protein O-mannosyl-transferase